MHEIYVDYHVYKFRGTFNLLSGTSHGLRANETRANWMRSIFSVPMRRVSVGRVPMRRVQIDADI